MRTNVFIRVTRAGQQAPVRTPVGLSIDEDLTYEAALAKVLEFGANAACSDQKVTT